MRWHILCSLFGHKRDKGWWGDGLYGRVHVGIRDGTGRGHARITGECDRCGQIYTLARFHADPDKLREALKP